MVGARGFEPPTTCTPFGLREKDSFINQCLAMLAIFALKSHKAVRSLGRLRNSYIFRMLKCPHSAKSGRSKSIQRLTQSVIIVSFEVRNSMSGIQLCLWLYSSHGCGSRVFVWMGLER
jgi:hypothetical protein